MKITISCNDTEIAQQIETEESDDQGTIFKIIGVLESCKQELIESLYPDVSYAEDE